SYTQFEYSALKVNRSADDITATVSVKNIGKQAESEVVQLYVRAVSPKQPRALKDLRGIQKLTLKPGETREATFKVTPGRDFTYYDVDRKTYAVDAGTYELQVGASSAD